MWFILMHLVFICFVALIVTAIGTLFIWIRPKESLGTTGGASIAFQVDDTTVTNSERCCMPGRTLKPSELWRAMT